MPLTQFDPNGQAFPQKPQLLLSFIGFTHTPLHKICPGWHATAAWQTPLTQFVPNGHTRAQEPQLLLSISGFTHTPPHAIWGN